MDANASILDLSAPRNAITSLEDALGVVDDGFWFGRQSDKVKNTLMAGVIQNFDFVHAIGVKMLKRRIETRLVESERNRRTESRDLPRVAGETGLILNLPAWFNYRQMRNITAHTYDQQKARRIHGELAAFLGDARSLLARLEDRNG